MGGLFVTLNLMAENSSVFFYVGAVGFAAGIFIRSLWQWEVPEIGWLILISLGMVAVLRRRRSTPAASVILFSSFFILLLALGALRLEIASWSIVSPEYEGLVGSEVTLEGIVVREPDERETTEHLYVDVEDEILLVIVSRYGKYQYGDYIRVTGLLGKPTSFETDLGRTFNYPGYLLARGVSYTVSFAEVTVLEEDAGNPALAALLTFKSNFMDHLESLIVEPQVGLSEGLLLGVKRALGDELETVFRETGIIHIVVLSGYNVMLVVAFVMYLFSRLLNPRFSAVFGVAAIAAFALLVGLSATVVRASIMASLLLIAGATKRIYFVMRGLILAGVIMLIINPYLLVFDTGFQLSFMATLGLIVGAPIVTEKLSLVPTFLGIREFLVATLVTQVFVLPLLLYQIGQFSLVAVVVNVLVLPMVPVAMLLTFVTGLVALFSSTIAIPLGFITYLALSYILVVATWFGNLSFASFVVPAFPFVVVPISYGLIGLVVWWILVKRHKQTDAELQEWTIVDESELETKGKGTPFFN